MKMRLKISEKFLNMIYAYTKSREILINIKIITKLDEKRKKLLNNLEKMYWKDNTGEQMKFER